MIRSIKSNNPNFKSIIFHDGFNVILADRTQKDKLDGKQTRNGAGKTTLVEILHFCLGSKVTSNSVFKNENLKEWSFILEIDIGNKIYEIERFTDCPSKIYINGDISTLNLECKYDKKIKRYYVAQNIFNKAMLEEFYGVVSAESEQEHMLSFRELISYSIRRNVEGYKSAFEFFSRQTASSIQICNAFFLNLSVDYAKQFQSIKDRKKGIENYKKAAKSGITGPLSLNIGELSSEVITRQKDVDSFQEQLDTFQIHPQYDDISKEANVLTYKIHLLANTLIIRKQLLERYETSYEKEDFELPMADIEKIYAEAGVLFQNSVLNPLSEVIEFHKAIISNRKEYLRNEITSLQKNITEIDHQIEVLSNKRSELMKILETHGALEEHKLVQDRYTEAKQLLEDAKKRLESAEYIEDSKSRLKIENQELLIKSRQDYNERAQIREQAISLFKDNIGYLYPEAGTLTIDLKESGYSFGVDIKSSRSQGVNYMKVFCYDMVLAELGSSKERYPDFLVHDSTIFDGVDERQVARALMLAQQKCDKFGYQYICLVNSDMIPYQEFDEAFISKFNNNIVLRISDNQENGGLLGIRF